MVDEHATYVQLLGPPRVQLGPRWVAFLPDKRYWLLAYLAYNGKWVARDELAYLFWPDTTTKEAKRNLRALLHRVQSLGWLANLEVERHRLRWVVDSDIAAFRQALGHGSFDEVRSLYSGPLLKGLECYDATEYQNWLEAEREHLHSGWRTVLLQRAGELEASGQHHQATKLLGELLRHDELDEEVLRQFISVAARAGQREEALRAYRAFAHKLRLELNLEPTSITQRLVHAVQHDEGRTPEEGRSPQARGVPAPPPVMPARPSPSLLATSFVGRDLELAKVRHLLSQADCRLLTLVGAGGVGKTRLAQQVMAESAHAYKDGACFVPLEFLSSPEFIPLSIAGALGLELQGQEEPLSQLVRFMKGKHLLVILDNFEHLLGGALLLSEVLRRCPNVRFLVTSRERLNLQEEWLLTVKGLSFPAKADTTLEEAAGYEAVQLFTQRANQVVLNFALTQQNQPEVSKICRLLDGVPLGIELAAVWVRVLPCKQIAQEIEKNLDVLEASTRDVVERHKSLRAAFEHSWRLLVPQEQEVLRKLSVFRGGFTKEAAFRVAGASIALLAALVDKSLVRLSPNGRYDRHPLLYQYTQEKLSADPEEEADIRSRHARYFMEFIGPGQAQAGHLHTQEHVEDELDNIAEAWRWAIAQRWLEVLQERAGALTEAFASRPYDVVPLFEEGLAVIRTLPETPARIAQELALEVALGPALMTTRGYASPELKENFAQARQHCELLGDSPQLFPVLWGLWGYYVIRGECKVALELAQQCLQVAQKVNDSALLVEAHRMLLESHLWLGEFSEAHTHVEQALRLEELQRSLLPFLHGHSSSVTFRGSGSVALWYLGYPDRSRKLSQDSMEVARASRHPNNLAIALVFAVMRSILGREIEHVRVLAEESFKLGKEHRLVLPEVFGLLGRSWVLTESGQPEEGLADLNRGMAIWEKSGAGLCVTFMYALLADANNRVGRVPEGLLALEKAFSHGRTFGEVWFEAELFRLKGELLRERNGSETEVEEAFLKSIEIARRQQAKAWELRAVKSLYRFRQSQGRSEEAPTLLEDVYRWFQEGLGTPELVEAAELLESPNVNKASREGRASPDAVQG